MLAQRLTINELCGDEVMPVHLADFVNGEDIRVI